MEVGTKSQFYHISMEFLTKNKKEQGQQYHQTILTYRKVLTEKSKGLPMHRFSNLALNSYPNRHLLTQK